MHLQQAAAACERSTLTLRSLATAAREQGDRLAERAQNALANAEAAAAARESTRQRTLLAQSMELQARDAVHVEALELARLQLEFEKLRASRDSAQFDVDRVCAATGATLDEHLQKVQTYAEQRQRLRVAAECAAVLGEAVAVARRFVTDELLQAQTVRALLTLCRKPGALSRVEVGEWFSLEEECVKTFKDVDGCRRWVVPPDAEVSTATD